MSTKALLDQFWKEGLAQQKCARIVVDPAPMVPMALRESTVVLLNHAPHSLEQTQGGTAVHSERVSQTVSVVPSYPPKPISGYFSK